MIHIPHTLQYIVIIISRCYFLIFFMPSSLSLSIIFPPAFQVCFGLPYSYFSLKRFIVFWWELLVPLAATHWTFLFLFHCIILLYVFVSVQSTRSLLSVIQTLGFVLFRLNHSYSSIRFSDVWEIMKESQFGYSVVHKESRISNPYSIVNIVNHTGNY